MDESKPDFARRVLLRNGLVLAAGVAAPLVFHAREARALSRAAVHYVEHAPGAKHCAGCISFVPGAKPDAPGTCYVVDGPVNPKGYCDEWSARPG